MNSRVIMLGAGGHAGVLLDILDRLGHRPHQFATNDADVVSKHFANLPRLGNDAAVLELSTNEFTLINAIGSIPGHAQRVKIFERFKESGFSFETVISPDACVSIHADIGEGVQIMPGAIVQTGVKIGANTIINTGAIVDHDCQIGPHCHVAPGATLSGDVVVSQRVHIGTGASVIHGTEIHHDAVVGAGAVLTKNLEAGHTAYPARGHVRFKKRA